MVIWIKRKLKDVGSLIGMLLEDEEVLEDAEPWRYLGFFFENCRQYLGRIDVAIPPSILGEADDVGRQLTNLEMIYEGEGVELAAKVGQVMCGWVKAQKRLQGTGIGRYGVTEDGQNIADLKVAYTSLLWNNAPRTYDDGKVIEEEKDEADEPSAKKARTA